MSGEIFENEKAQLVVDNVLLNGLESELTENNAVSKFYVDSKLQTAVDGLNTTDGVINQRIDVMSMGLESETSTRYQVDTDLQTAIDNEALRAQNVESSQSNSISNLEDNKLNKSGGSLTGDVKLVDSYLNFGDNWRVKASGDGSKIVFQHKKADGVWRTAVPFIYSPN